MVERIDAVEAEQLIADGVRTLDVLPAEVFEQVHLPGATSMPLEEFDPTEVESFDRSEPLLVYCFDQHCDLSARNRPARTARFRPGPRPDRWPRRVDRARPADGRNHR